LPSSVGHRPVAVITAPIATITEAEQRRTRKAVVRVRCTVSSRRGSCEPAIVLIRTAAIPRSAKGSSVVIVLSRPYWA
jgi:hypothetical protein